MWLSTEGRGVAAVADRGEDVVPLAHVPTGLSEAGYTRIKTLECRGAGVWPRPPTAEEHVAPLTDAPPAQRGRLHLLRCRYARQAVAKARSLLAVRRCSAGKEWGVRPP